MVRISFWLLPLSPTAVRAALMQLVRVDFGHNAAAPDQRDEVILADNAVAILHQMDQEVEHLRLHGNPMTAPKQLAASDIKHMILKDKLHATPRTASALKK